ncbi:MAG TPA: oligosaccharide flippase family protein [Phycisphaerae bacterium]|nr:oligosaccharide flippase family protein [Phycisphaerae bacterium]
MSNARIHARNLAANWIGHGASLVVLFFLSPFMVRTLGKTEYGIWSLLMVLTGYMGLFDLGARASTGRFITYYLGKEDHTALGETVRTGLGFFSAVGVLILGAGVVLGMAFPHFFPSAPQEYHGLVVILLPVLAINLWFSGIAAVFSSVLTAHDRFDLTRGVDLGVLALRTVGTVLALVWGYGIVGLAIVTLGCQVVALAGNWFFAKRVYRRLVAWPPQMVRSRLKELIRYGVAVFLSRIGYLIIGRTDLVVVGALIGVSAVTTYSIGAMLVYYSWTFVTLIASTLFPSLQRSAARGEDGAVRWIFFRQLRLCFLFGLLAYVGFIVFGQSFINLWMKGPEFPEASVAKAAVVMAVLSAAQLLALPGVAASAMHTAKNRVWFSASITMAEAIANLGLSLFFVIWMDWGLAGVALGTLVSAGLMRTIVKPWNACRLARVRTSELLKLAAAALLSAIVFGGWCVLIRALLPAAESWGLFALQVGLAVAGYVPLALVFLIPRSDRERIVRPVRALIARRQTPSEP